MIAVQYRKSIPRYLLLRLLSRWFPNITSSRLSPVSLVQIDPPKLPGARWLRVSPKLAGICGSDLATVAARNSPYLSPLVSMPFVLGHELVGTISEVGTAVTHVAVKDRVVVQPALGCLARGIDPPCVACAAGDMALCTNVTAGDISAGIQMGFCRDTGGAWSESLVAHESQVYKVPDDLEDELAVLVEPFACAIHAVLRALPQPSDTVVVVGCGAIGLLTITALRALGCVARIVALAKHAHQSRLAAALGADEVVRHERFPVRYQRLAEVLDARVLPAQIGKPAVIGGADVTFDCVASSASIDDSCRFTRAGGVLVLVGMPAVPSGVDWTAIWYKELSIRAAYAYGVESVDGRQVGTFDLALELLGSAPPSLRHLVGEPYALRDYRQALRAAMNTGASGSIKTVFRV